MSSVGRLARLITSIFALVLALCGYAITDVPKATAAIAATTYAYDQPGEHAQATAHARPAVWSSRVVLQPAPTDRAAQPVLSAPTGFAAEDVPTVVFSRSRAPGIADNFDNAVSNGAPTRLTRVDAALRRANRRDALRGQPRAPAGQSLDEYPFACSAHGGCGSFVRSVPVSEQNYRGGVLSRFFQDFGVNPGDPFDVMFGP